MSRGIFVTATGTDVGKTYLCGLLVKRMRALGMDAGYYKAALSGAEWRDGQFVPGDADFVCRTAGLSEQPQELVSYVYEHAVSPHLAARLEGNPPDLERIAADYQKLAAKHDYMVIEGSGGLLCPLRVEEQSILMLTDVMRRLGQELLVVAPAGLGTINATALTIQQARNEGLNVRGVLLNWFHPGDVMEEDNRALIERLTDCPVIGYLGEGADELPLERERLEWLFGAATSGKDGRP